MLCEAHECNYNNVTLMKVVFNSSISTANRYPQ